MRGGRAEKAHILVEFVFRYGFYRKQAMRLLRKSPSPSRSGPEARSPHLASDRICGKRLKALVPIPVEAMERHGHLHLTVEIRTGL